MSFLGLARRYRPQRLAVEGRVYDPTPDFPFSVEVRPWMDGIMVSVTRGGHTTARFVATRDMDDPAVDTVASFAAAQLGP
jgi:hypothetical protein